MLMEGRFLLPFFIVLFFSQTLVFSQKSGAGGIPDKAIIDTLAARGMIKNPEPVRPDIQLSRESGFDISGKNHAFSVMEKSA